MTQLLSDTEQFYKLISFALILANCVIRSKCPSQYVPMQRTCATFWGSPYFARTLATFAEFAFYRQVARTLGISHMWWFGSLLGIWIIGECLSWIGLVLQNRVANATEDIMWCVWFIVAYLCSTNEAKYVLIPIIAYYVLVHIPFLIKDLKESANTQNQTPEHVDKLNTSGYWVVMSVIAKLILYILFVFIESQHS